MTPKHPQGKSETDPHPFIVEVTPYFHELTPRYKCTIVRVLEDDLITPTRITVHSQTVSLNTKNTTPHDLITNYIHRHGFRRTNKFLRVNDMGVAKAPIEIMQTPGQSEVERLGVL